MRAIRRKIFTGAKIVTLWDEVPEAEAVCVAEGRIEAVGSLADVAAYASPGPCKIVDLGGGVLYPGFIDTHSHLSSYSKCIEQVHCGGERSTPEAACAALRKKAASTGNPGGTENSWVLGYAYDDTLTPTSGHLTRLALDAVCADRPVFVSHVSLHFAYANTAALKELGLMDGKVIPGGEVVLGADGLPTGLLSETAAFYAFDRLPAPDAATTAENMVKAVAEYNRCGFTTIIDGGIGFNGDARTMLRAYASLARAGRLDARCYLQMIPPVMEDFLPYGLWSLQSDFLSLGGAKFFADGSIQGFTAALCEAYHTKPQLLGDLLQPEEEVAEFIARHHAEGIQTAVHVNGDRALETALAAFEAAYGQDPRKDLRHMLIHAQMASDSQLERMQACGIIPTFFSRHIEVWGDRHRDVFLGPERASRLNPAGTCVRLGMPFGLHVDTPVLPVTALGSMHAAVNRKTSSGAVLGSEQRISPRDALLAYTAHAALCCMGEHDRGRIEPGRYADFVLLGEAIEEASPDCIKNIPVRMTICGGKTVYDGT
ncbi:amidohydrolase [Desulfovibrio sp. OttesenSCG-928-G15]|nr:amidohydrolase [Desulfovibrio sp. OttesenSCG-928-G15]